MEARVPELLDLIYGAAVDPQLWPGVLRRLEDATGSHNAVLTRQNERTGKGEGLRARPNPDATRLYYGHFATRNVFLEAEDARRALRSYRPEVLTDQHKIAKSDLVRSEYYNDFMRVFDIDAVLMVRLAVIGSDTVVLNLHRTRLAGAYGADEIGLAETLLPHLVRAAEVSRKLGEARAPEAGLAQMLDRSPHGLFLVDDAGRVIWRNAAGQALATSGRAHLRLAGGRLTGAEPRLSRRLEAMIAAAASPDPELRTGASLALNASEHGGPLALSVTPAGPERLPVFRPVRSAAFVCAADPEAPLDLSVDTLRGLYDLTPAEARVASLLHQGLAPTDIAAHLALSLPTIRIHLAHIFDKTGTRGQVELVRILTRVAEMAGTPKTPAS